MASALINRDSDKIYSCKYKIGTLAFMMEDEELIIDPLDVVSIVKYDNIDNWTRSKIILELRVDIRQKIWIIKNRTKMVCKLELNKTGLDPTGEGYVNGYEECWNQEFSIHLTDDDETIDTALLEGSMANTGDGEFKASDIQNTNYFESDNILQVILFNQALLDQSNTKVNFVSTSDTVQNVAGRILTESKHKNVLMSKCDNSEVYDELLIPHLKAYQALLYLDQYYGLYKKGGIIFYDTDICYIINTCAKVTAKRDKEWAECTFLVTSTPNTVPGGSMLRKQEEEKYYILVNEQDVLPKKPSIENNETLGSIIHIISIDDTGIETIETDTETISQKNEININLRADNNQYTDQIIKARIEETESILYVALENADITAFTPNKRYNFAFDNAAKQTKYGKNKYRLAYAYHMIYAGAGSYLDSTHKLMFKKCASND